MDLKNYKGKILTTDEYAEGKNQIIKDIHDLESIALKTGKDYLLLKWGTIKSFGLKIRATSQNTLPSHQTPEI